MYKNFKVYIKTQLTGGFIELQNEPDGLRDYENTLIRHKKYKSVFVDVTFDLKFVLDGRTLIKSAFDDSGIAATCEILIDELNTQTGGFENIFDGVADFQEYREEELFVSIPFDSAGRLQKLTARDGIKYNIENDESTGGTIVPNIAGLIQETQLPAFDFLLWANTVSNWLYSGNFTLGGDPPQTTTIQMATIKSFDVRVNFMEDRFSPNQNEPFYTSPRDGMRIRLTGVFVWDLSAFMHPHSLYNSGFVKLKARLVMRDDTGAEVWNKEFYNLNYTSTDITHTNTGAFDLSVYNMLMLNANYTLGFEGEIVHYNDYSDPNPDPSRDGMDFITKFNNTISDFWVFENKESVHPYDAKIAFPFETFARLIQLSTDETDLTKLFSSSLLGRTDSAPVSYPTDGEFSLLGLTSGKAIRAGHVINISFRDLFDSLNAIVPVGIWYNRNADVFVLEHRDEFFRNQLIAEFGEVSEFIISPDKDGFFSEIEGGCKNDSTYDFINGVVEFNTATKYSAPIYPTRGTLKIESPFRFDTLGINAPRLSNKDENGTNDNKFDNNNFMIDCKRSGSDFVALSGADYDEINGIPNGEQYYNIRLTPKRNLMRFGKYIRSAAFNFGGAIKYVRSKNDINLSTRLTAGDPLVSEMDDLNISSLSAPIFEPIIYEFEFPVNIDQRQIIKQNPHGFINFHYDGKMYSGFILEARLNSSQNKGVFKLIKKH